MTRVSEGQIEETDPDAVKPVIDRAIEWCRTDEAGKERTQLILITLSVSRRAPPPSTAPGGKRRA